MGKLFLLVALLGCDYYDRVADADGEVYECEQADGSTVELCYFEDSANELADLTGATSCELTGRAWPWLTNHLSRGCRYACPPPGPGCNAEQGCYCPDDSARTLTGNAREPVVDQYRSQPLGEVDDGQHLIPLTSMLSTAVLDLMHVTGDGVCESGWMQPALGCGRDRLQVLDFDGCHWRCTAIIDLPRGERQ